MRPSPFFRRRLDPVLDGGKGHKDPVVPPQMPTRHAVGKTILDHQTHRLLLYAVGVMALGESQVVHVRVEASSAGGTLMLGVGQVKVQGPAATCIAQVVQDPSSRSIAPGPLPAERTAPPPVVAAPPLDAWRRKILHPRNPFRTIRDIVTRTVHDRSSRRSASRGNIGHEAPATPTIRTSDATVSVFRHYHAASDALLSVVEMRSRDKPLDRQQAIQYKGVNVSSTRSPTAHYTGSKPELRILCGLV